MNIYKYLAFLYFSGFLLTSCSDNNYQFKLNTTSKVDLGEKAMIEFKQLGGEKIDSVHIYIDSERINKNETIISFNTMGLGVGKHLVTAIAFFPNKSKKLSNAIEIFANKTPDLYKFKIVNTYPHDNQAFTQGLEYYKGFLYETTGKKGKSSLRKVEIKTGKVVQKIDLNEKYFGEGMTIFNDQIFWLTWQSRKGFIFSLDDFKKIGSFNYGKSNEGWGLTHNDNELIKSDGTNKIWFLNPSNQKEQRNIQVYTNKLTIEELNELELINGKIYANYWKKPLIAIINPNNGIVEGIINLTDLVKHMKKTQRLADNDEVLNGIAFDEENDRIFVTGKHWNKLFEIQIIKQ